MNNAVKLFFEKEPCKARIARKEDQIIDLQEQKLEAGKKMARNAEISFQLEIEVLEDEIELIQALGNEK